MAVENYKLKYIVLVAVLVLEAASVWVASVTPLSSLSGWLKVVSVFSEASETLSETWQRHLLVDC